MEILASHSSESWSKVGKRLPPQQGCNEAGALPICFPFPPLLAFLSSPLQTPSTFSSLAVTNHKPLIKLNHQMWIL